MNKKSLFSFSWPKATFLAIVLIAFMASAMTVNTLSQTQPTLIVGGQDVAIQAQPFVKTAMALNMVRTDQGLATLTQKPIASQFAPFTPAVAEVPENYYILASITIKAKNGTMAVTKNIYLLKTVIASRLATTAQKTLKI